MILPDVRIYSKLTIGTTVYEEDDLHKPYFTKTAARQGDFKSFAKDADRLYTFTDVQPRKGKEFEEMELDIAWDEFAGCKLFATPKLVVIKFPSLNMAGAYTFVYGWVDDAEPVATKGPQTNTRIKWHVDWWLTWADYNWFMESGQMQILANWFPRRVTIGAGRLLKGPSQFARPSSSAPRKWLLDSAVNMIDDRDPYFDIGVWWAVMCTTKTSGAPPLEVITDIVYYFWPIGEKISGAANTSPDWVSIYTGQIEEEIGIDPSRIQGFWLAPFKPWTGGEVRDLTGVSVYELTSVLSGNVNIKTLTENVQTDDKHKIVFTDPTGAEMFTAPWGITFKNIVTWFDIGTSAASLCVYLGETDIPIEERQGVEGRFFSFPLPSLPVTENAWSSYVYSGQRDYDMQQKAIQRDRSAVNGIAGIGTQAIGGALAGTAAAPGPGTALGAVAGLASGIIGTAVNYFTAGEFDSRDQRNVDNLTSRQTAGMIVNAGGYYGLIQPYGSMIGWNMLTMVRDPVSLAEIEVEQEELGYDTDTYVVDCTNLISAGGPLRIEGLRVRGDIPKEGKEYIAGLFSRGVHIDLIS